MSGKKKPYIRNGMIVYDATESDRLVSSLFRFPGQGQRLTSGVEGTTPAPAHSETIRLRPRQGDDELVQFVENGGGPPPPSPGRERVGGSSITFPVSGCCKGNSTLKFKLEKVGTAQQFKNFFREVFASVSKADKGPQLIDLSNLNNSNSTLPELTPIVRIRCLDGILTVCYRRQSNRRIFIHSDAGIEFNSAAWVTKLLNRLAAPDQGRENPKWKNSAFTPLHFHAMGYCVNLIYSWQNGCLYVHGVVDFHMDQKMTTKEEGLADEIEKRGTSLKSFSEVLILSASQMVDLSELLEKSIEELQEILHEQEGSS